MKNFWIVLVSAGLCAGQDNSAAEAGALAAQVNARIAEANAVLAQVRAKTTETYGLTGTPREGVKVTVMRDQYDAGLRSLDAHRYDDAIRQFDAVALLKNPRSDGALYWEAYALNRAGQRDRALQVLDSLRKQYAGSRWLADAQALEVEVKQGTGAPVSPAEESNEDIKLMAINSLMHSDPERAMPSIEALLKGNSSPRLKDRALFVLTQSRSPRAQQILMDYAKGVGNPDLQTRAVRYVGMSGTPEAQQQLASIYSASNEAAVKGEVLRALVMAKGRDQLFSIAKNEKDESLRAEAIRQLGALRATDLLAQLEPGASQQAGIELVHAFAAARAGDKLFDLAKNSKDPRVRREAVFSFNAMRDVTPDFASLYGSETDAGVRRAILTTLMTRGEAKAMVELARKESNPAAKRDIVGLLSGMRNNKDASDYMMELLK